jgi:hypothetical protein
VTRMQLMLNICFFFPTLRFLATYSCYTLMSSSQQQLDHAPHLLYLVKYMSRRRSPSVLQGWFSQPNRYHHSRGISPGWPKERLHNFLHSRRVCSVSILKSGPIKDAHHTEKKRKSNWRPSPAHPPAHLLTKKTN